MNLIKPTPNKYHWPRHGVKEIKCRKRDLVVRIANWTRCKDACGWDVEVYIGGVYDWTESKSFTLDNGRTKAQAHRAAIEFAAKQGKEMRDHAKENQTPSRPGGHER